jgi:hypothetical protein
MRTVLTVLLTLLSQNGSAEWSRLAEDEKGSTIYVDRTTLRQEGGGAQILSLTDYQSNQLAADIPFRSSIAHIKYDCSGDRMRVLKVDFYSNQMGIGKQVYSDKTAHQWLSVSPSSLGNELHSYACSIWSADGAKHKYSQNELPGWRQGPSTDDADVFFNPKSTHLNKNRVRLWVIVNFKNLYEMDGKLHWSAKSRIVFDCGAKSSRIDVINYYDLPYSKGNRTIAHPSTFSESWKSVSSTGLSMGMWKVVCGK